MNASNLLLCLILARGNFFLCVQFNFSSFFVIFKWGVIYFFFVKQKTAYEIGTGDWSSAVCSSDPEGEIDKIEASFNKGVITDGERYLKIIDQIGRASCRERV